MLQALDKMRLLSDGTEITRERVASVFGVDYIEHLIQYFETLGAGGIRQQTAKFLQWPDSIRNKARLVQLFLLGLYYVELCELDVAVDPVIASIRQEERSRVTDAFTRRLPQIDMKAFFEGLLDVWPVITGDLSEEALLAILMRFQAVTNRGEVVARTNDMVARIAPQAVSEAEVATGTSRGRSGYDDADAPKDPAYLTRSHVRSIFTAASFLVQSGHQPFNARITIRHRLFGHEEQPAASAHFARFSQALKGNWRDGAPLGSVFSFKNATKWTVRAVVSSPISLTLSWQNAAADRWAAEALLKRVVELR